MQRVRSYRIVDLRGRHIMSPMGIGEKYHAAATRRALSSPKTPYLSAGAPAPATAVYVEHNVFGTPTGRAVDVSEGEPMPRAALGFTWLPATQMLKQTSQ